MVCELTVENLKYAHQRYVLNIKEYGKCEAQGSYRQSFKGRGLLPYVDYILSVYHVDFGVLKFR